MTRWGRNLCQQLVAAERKVEKTFIWVDCITNCNAGRVNNFINNISISLKMALI